MVKLYLSAAQKIEGIKGQVFNIGGGIKNSSSLLELFGFLESELDIKMSYKNLPPRDSDQKEFLCQIYLKQKNLLVGSLKLPRKMV